MTEGRMSQIVCKTCYLEDVWITTQGFAEFPGNLSNFEGMRESGAREIVVAGHHYLGFRRQPAKGRTMQYPRPITSEGAAHTFLDGFGNHPGNIIVVVADGRACGSHPTTVARVPD